MLSLDVLLSIIYWCNLLNMSVCVWNIHVLCLYNLGLLVLIIYYKFYAIYSIEWRFCL